jgi:cell division protein FtsB
VADRSASVVRWVALALLALLFALQLKLWTGAGGVPEVWRLEARVEQQAQDNEARRARNAALAADVEDLKSGREAVEERARSELGMIKPGETFYQVVEPAAAASPTPEGP